MNQLGITQNVIKIQLMEISYTLGENGQTRAYLIG